MFIKASDFLSEEPSQCVVVEDATAGINASKAAAMKAVGVGEADGARGYHDNIKLQSSISTGWCNK